MTRLNRRQALQAVSASLGSLAFAAMTTRESLAARTDSPLAPRETHFPARAKRVIMLFMNGAPSHVDTFDYKPQLIRADGQAGGGPVQNHLHAAHKDRKAHGTDQRSKDHKDHARPDALQRDRHANANKKQDEKYIYSFGFY